MTQPTENTTERGLGPWQPKNNGSGKRIWFLHREAPEIMDRYRWDARDNLIRYASYETAKKAAKRLNANTS